MATNQRELCRYFLHGVCRFGSNCFNSHDINDRSSTVCQYYLKGCCSYGNSCRYDHIKPKINNESNNNNNNTSSNSQISVLRKLDDSNINSNMLILSKKNINKDSNENSSNELNSSTSNEEISNHSNKSYYEALTGNKETSNSNNNDDEFDPFDETTHYQVVVDQTTQLCPYFEKDAQCPFGFECQYLHGELCELCSTPCLHPFNQEQQEQHRQECMKQLEKDMEEAFATQRSQEKQCGICMEIVWEKEKTDQCFGILENCNHVFCLACIRKWRASKSYENKIVKACPECRVKSDFVTPSKFWFENETDKAKIIDDYKNKLGKTACKYFKQGSGHCPFGNKCFYQHIYPDGTKAELPSPTQRRRFNHSGILESFSNIVRVDFDLSDDDIDIDLIEFLRQNLLLDNIETESDFSDISITDLFDDYHYPF